ncbi:unnamed protein product [Leuciscus chuanchicus]
MSEQKEQRAGENHIFVDVIFRVWFSQGNHKAFKCRSEDVVLSSIKQPEADGENPENSKKRGHGKISFLREHSGAVHGRPARDTVTGRKSRLKDDPDKLGVGGPGLTSHLRLGFSQPLLLYSILSGSF